MNNMMPTWRIAGLMIALLVFLNATPAEADRHVTVVVGFLVVCIARLLLQNILKALLTNGQGSVDGVELLAKGIMAIPYIAALHKVSHFHFYAKALLQFIIILDLPLEMFKEPDVLPAHAVSLLQSIFGQVDVNVRAFASLVCLAVAHLTSLMAPLFLYGVFHLQINVGDLGFMYHLKNFYSFLLLDVLGSLQRRYHEDPVTIDRDTDSTDTNTSETISYQRILFWLVFFIFAETIAYMILIRATEALCMASPDEYIFHMYYFVVPFTTFYVNHGLILISEGYKWEIPLFIYDIVWTIPCLNEIICLVLFVQIFQHLDHLSQPLAFIHWAEVVLWLASMMLFTESVLQLRWSYFFAASVLLMTSNAMASLNVFAAKNDVPSWLRNVKILEK